MKRGQGKQISKHWFASQATASPSFPELHLLSYRRFLGCCPHHALQDRGYGTRYQDIAPVVFHNHLVLQAVFRIVFWKYTCDFHLHVAGGTLTLPQLSLTPGWGMHLTHCLIRYLLPPLFHYSLLGCVAATLNVLLIITSLRVCRCHPSCLHFAGCVAATSILCWGAPNKLQSHLLPNIVFLLVVMAYIKRQSVWLRNFVLFLVKKKYSLQ